MEKGAELTDVEVVVVFVSGFAVRGGEMERGVGEGVISVLGDTSTSSASRYHFRRRVYFPQPSTPLRPFCHWGVVSLWYIEGWMETYLIVVVYPAASTLTSTVTRFGPSFICVTGAFNAPLRFVYPSPSRCSFLYIG